ncbi:hypothetical protein AB6A40_003610 [Gnathostoma spinigerum]|uniref:Uncharacterized protein n=1 Tax=Gnathostoma spinigerum TaxID=75299 RepID=A0ABD6EHN8_9BILA
MSGNGRSPKHSPRSEGFCRNGEDTDEKKRNAQRSTYEPDRKSEQKTLPDEVEKLFNVAAPGEGQRINFRQPPPPKIDSQRRLIIVRHAELVDSVFPSWLKNSTQSGEFTRYNLNQPKSLPERENEFEGFTNDSPITVIGHLCAELLAKSILNSSYQICRVISSPALGCIQTAAEIIEHTGLKHVNLQIETGLHDWMGYYDEVPTWMTVKELLEAGYKVSKEYKAVSSEADKSKFRMENKGELCRRTIRVLDELLRNLSGTALLVTHAINIEVIVRILLKMRPVLRTEYDEMTSIHRAYPFCTAVVMNEDLKTREWRLERPLQSITFTGFSNKYDENYLLRDFS